MSFKSEAQRAKFKKMVEEGRLDQATYDQWETNTKGAKLPERVEKKPKRKSGPHLVWAKKASKA